MSHNSTNPLTTDDDTGDGERYLGVASMCRRYDDCSRMTIWRWTRAGHLPAPRYVGKRPFWALSELRVREASWPKSRPTGRAA